MCIFKQSQSSHLLSILKLISSSVISFRRGMCYTPCKTVIKDINAIVNDYRIPVRRYEPGTAALRLNAHVNFLLQTLPGD
ncbi:hypothetical protein AOY77_02960 [Escherichia coli]|nr:hypothetical protein AOY77_02960 [Escherichia coli]